MIIGFDIGGTAIKGAAVPSPDAIGPVTRVPTPTQDFDAFVEAMKTVISASGEAPERVAISIAGVMDPDSGTAICANIACLHGRRLRAELAEALGLPVTIANDADCFTFAEAVVGAGQGHRIVFGAILGTGVGGGLVADGRLVNAAGGFAGEWGHGPVTAAFAGTPPLAIPAYRCGCGQERCIETVGSARGMERLHELAHGREAACEAIVEAWQAGDDDAARTVDIFIDLLSAPLSLVVNATGATIVPVGGGLGKAEALIAALDGLVRERILRRLDRPLVVPGTCRYEPGIVGAALLSSKVADSPAQ